MVQAFKELMRNYRDFRKLEKHIDDELRDLGIEGYVQKYYGEEMPSGLLEPKHA